MRNSINIFYLYPDICNLHGDRGNIWAFEKVGKSLGVEINVTRIDALGSPIDFKNADILLVSPGELTHLLTIKDSLAPIKDQIFEYIDQNKYFIAIGTSGALFTKILTRLDGSTHEGLGIINGTAKELEKPYGDDIIFSCAINHSNMKVSGSQIQMVDFSIDDDSSWGDISYGYGNNRKGKEGYKKNNFLFTNCLGPIFAKNPWLADTIIRDIANKKGISINPSLKCDFSLEETSYVETEKFNMSKELPR